MCNSVSLPTFFDTRAVGLADDTPRSLNSAESVPCETSLLPEPAPSLFPSGDPGAELAQMVLEAAKEDKKLGRSMRQAEERAQRAAEESQLKAMEEKADAAFCSGMMSGFGTAASGAVGIVGAGQLGNATEATSRSVDMKWNGLAKVPEAGGKLTSTAFQADADVANEAMTHEEQIAGRHKRAADDARDQVKDAKDLIDRAISFYKEYTTATSDTQRAALLKA